MSYEDPFAAASAAAAPAPAPEPAPAPPAVQQQAAPATVASAFRPASTSEGKVVTTFKGGTGYDAPWVVVHSDTVGDAVETLKDPQILELMSLAQSGGKYFSGLAPAGSAPAQQGQAAQPQQSRAPRGATEPPAWAPPPPFPDFVYRSGVTKTGRNAGQTWHAWMPPQKDDPQGRNAEFFNAPR